MTVLIDTNVIVDILLNNAGFVANSRALLDFAEKNDSSDISPLLP